MGALAVRPGATSLLLQMRRGGHALAFRSEALALLAVHHACRRLVGRPGALNIRGSKGPMAGGDGH